MSVDAKTTPISASLFARVGQATRYVISGVTPNGWFGPQQPTQPMAPPEVKGRQFDYPFGVNLNYTPRASEPISFADLRSLADALPLLRAIVETRKDQVAALDWTVRPLRSINRNDASERATRAAAFLARPDRRHSFEAWLRMLLEDMLVIDAACLYPRFASGGALYSLDVIDGSTITPLIGLDGRAPDAPDPAYQQVLHGIPAADFSADELIYRPRNVRSHRVYGFSPVEQIALTINIALRRDAATLEYYNSGNIPDSFATLPKEWTPDQIRSFQDYFDALLSGNLGRRRMLKFVPSEFKLIEARQPPLKDLYDEWLARLICYAFSVPASAFITQVNRATSATLRLQATQEGLIPLKGWIKGLLDTVVQEHLGESDLEFAWVGDDAVDPLQQAQTLNILVAAGIKTREEARAELGLEGPPPKVGGTPHSTTIGKYNSNHDDAGLFSPAENAVAPGGRKTPQSTQNPTGVQVASRTDLASDTKPDRNGSVSDQQLAGLTVVHAAPSDAAELISGDGSRFLAPPSADFSRVFDAGRAGGKNPFTIQGAIGHFGPFDYQRRGNTFYSAYTNASNYAVGVYMAGAGFSLTETIVIAGGFARLYSSNAGSQLQKDWWKKGWRDATNGVLPHHGAQ